MDVSEARLVEMRNNLDLLGLRTKNQDYIYPAWQLDASGKLMPEVGEILRKFDQIANQPREKLYQMVVHLPFYEGKSIKDCLVAGDTGFAIEVANKMTLR